MRGTGIEKFDRLVSVDAVGPLLQPTVSMSCGGREAPMSVKYVQTWSVRSRLP